MVDVWFDVVVVKEVKAAGRAERSFIVSLP